MGTIKREYDYGKFIERYMYEHAHTMFVLVAETNDALYKVLYANTLAIDYFSGNVLMSGKHFFREFWKEIEHEINNMDELSKKRTEIEVLVNDELKLFELNLQKNEQEEREPVIFLELCERRDLIVERKNLSELESKYELVIDHNLDPIIAINKKGEILNTNPAIYPAFGYRKKELVNKSILKFIEIDEIERLNSMIIEGFQGESIELAEFNILHKRNIYLPIHVKVLPVLVDGEVAELHLIIRDLSKYYEYNEKFLFLSYRDQLTGLLNRKALKKDFVENRAVAIKNEQKVSIVHIGLDRFKLINDALGYNSADEILKSIGKRLKDICSSMSRVYRNGGDEFIIVLENHSIEKTEEIAQLVLGEFGNPFYFNNQEYFISASIGISIFPDDGENIEKLLRKSEQAMFYVKENGRSHYRFYAKEMKSLISNEVLMESHLRRAIELDEFKVYYQPQVDLKTGYVSSFEALLRWNNRKFGFVSPGQFIKIAEDSGLIHRIGDWVLDQVCKQLRQWEDKNYREVSIAVNISPKQFRMAGFAKSVEGNILKYEIRPSSLEVEITESSLANMQETLSTLKELKKIGVGISVDDFGTGYSSLSYLKQYPIDIIKIDQSFIRDIEFDEKNEAIAKTIINLAHNLGMEVIAEGVEKELQAGILLNANCQKAQGFLYSKALPVEEIVEKYMT